MLLMANLANTKWCKKEMAETLTHGYSSERTQQELSNEYQHARVQRSLHHRVLDESSLSIGIFRGIFLGRHFWVGRFCWRSGEDLQSKYKVLHRIIKEKTLSSRMLSFSWFREMTTRKLVCNQTVKFCTEL